MADGVVLPDERQAKGGTRGLTSPFPTPPGAGEAVTVAPGVLWLRLPLPMSLNHINVYALEDGDGWALVDTGLNTPDAIAGWETALAGPLGGRPVTRVICTHMHPDHIGLAGWLPSSLAVAEGEKARRPFVEIQRNSLAVNCLRRLSGRVRRLLPAAPAAIRR